MTNTQETRNNATHGNTYTYDQIRKIQRRCKEIQVKESVELVHVNVRVVGTLRLLRASVRAVIVARRVLVQVGQRLVAVNGL